MSERDVILVRRFVRRFRFTRMLQAPLVMGRHVVSRIPQAAPAGVVWTCLAAFAAISATEIELRQDVYSQNSAEGGLRLKPLDATVARAMINKPQRIREQDKFFNFEIGTRTVGNQLANRKTEFTFGDMMIAQANLNPPHEDMWIECLIQDSEQRTIEQFGQFVTREMLRANFVYKIGNKLVPGDYSMVLKSANQEVYRRHFQLSGTPENQYTVGGITTN